MAVHLRCLLILTGLTGIHSITTVSEVSVKAGDSISIPCFYDLKYMNHVKYLCKGSTWRSCSYAIKTNQQNSEKFSISDNKSQGIFTVTIKDLKDEDTDDYWCAVDRGGWLHVKEKFHLSVTRGTPSLYVDHQEITGFRGDDLTISCHYRNSGETQWCRPGVFCVKPLSGSIDGTRVTINASVPNVFTVTMSELRTESSGWYWCFNGNLEMPVHVTVTEKPTTRIHSITTVSEVSVKAGDSISIPCFYNLKYMNHVKYLCKGSKWISCSYAIKTNQQNSEKFSISDNKSQGIFTVTIKDLKDEDTDDYWCAVDRGVLLHVKQKFHLSVTRGTPSLYVDHQEITGFRGDDLTISCHYRNSGETQWCRPGVFCVTPLSGSIDGTRVTINASVPNVFIVTMSGLRTESSGWYWCFNGNLEMPVHVTVTEKPTTATGTTGLTSVSPTLESVNLTPVFASNASTAQGGHPSPSEHQKIFFIRLSVLIFAAMVTLIICFMINRHIKTKVESSATTAEEEVRYMRKTSDERSDAGNDDDGI